MKSETSNAVKTKAVLLSLFTVVDGSDLEDNKAGHDSICGQPRHLVPSTSWQPVRSALPLVRLFSDPADGCFADMEAHFS